jgi:hypothetical protein
MMKSYEWFNSNNVPSNPQQKSSQQPQQQILSNTYKGTAAMIEPVNS